MKKRLLLVCLTACLSAHPFATPTVRHVTTAAQFQPAIDASLPGDTVLAAPGSYQVSLVLRRSGVTIAADTDALVPGRRVSPDMWPSMITLIGSGSTAPVRITAGVTDITIRGFAIATWGNATTPLIDLSVAGTTDPALLPSNITVDQVLLTGTAGIGGKRGIALNTRQASVTNSDIRGFWSNNADSQAIWGAYGPGPFLIVNNYLEASGENILFGGADNLNASLNPSDITIRDNTISKPLAWQPTSTGNVKNNLELKNATRVLVEGNLIENCWMDGQNGILVGVSVRNQGGLAPWSNVSDVTFQYNVFRNAAGIVSITGHDDIQPAQRTVNVKFLNNLAYNINTSQFPGVGRLVSIYHAPLTVEFGHNTFLSTPTNGGNAFLSLQASVYGLDDWMNWHDNVVSEGGMGIIGNGNITIGLPTLQALWSVPFTFTTNLIAKGTSGRNIAYGTGNYKTTNAGESPVGADFRLLPAYAALPSTDGQPLGANITAIEARVPGLSGGGGGGQ